MSCNASKSLQHYYRRFRRFLCISLSLFFALWIFLRSSIVSPSWFSITGSTRSFAIQGEFEKAPLVAEHSVTAILAVSAGSLPRLSEILRPFFQLSVKRLRHVVVLAPEDLVPATRRAVSTIIQRHTTRPHPTFVLRPWVPGYNSPNNLLEEAMQVTTNWTLLMDVQGLLGLDQQTQYRLLNPLAISVPVGPKGSNVTSGGTITCSMPSNYPQTASFLHPPFVSPTRWLNSSRQSGAESWEEVGTHIAHALGDGTGGIVVGRMFHQMDWCRSLSKSINPLGTHQVSDVGVNFTALLPGSPPLGVFAVFLPTIQDLTTFAPVICRLTRSGHSVHVLVYQSSVHWNFGPFSKTAWSQGLLDTQFCRLSYSTPVLSRGFPRRQGDLKDQQILAWFSSLGVNVDIAITLADAVAVHRMLMGPTNAVHIRIPPSDLPYCAWMGSLGLEEWQNWYKPHIEISVITKDRPRSLTRLLTSLGDARYYGDSANLRIMIEQSTERSTLRIVDNWNWTHGNILTHHRIIHAGLLPAVVESWYPHGNDTYGLLLEDDVELSPMFYAWAKMTVLKYRYASPASPSLFGISLYQQKHIELPLEGRHAFNPRTLFSVAQLPHPTTPYLSPIPCSWGAIYFPEHWREFHEYLGIRLEKSQKLVPDAIVPGVRSNFWTKSWKKYFIELVYLRGYVMLYPNYPNFVSLSTNHLELGSHVKSAPREKQALFTLPLMPLPIAPEGAHTGLLQLPGETLPSWQQLPVLNLTGTLTTLDTLRVQGEERRQELTECREPPSIPYNASQLLCT